MAPTSNSKGGKSTIKGMKELIEQFCVVTGSDENLARQMIETCNGNLEMAINMHMESQTDCIQETDTVADVPPPPPPSTEVRAPIPQTKGVLVEEGYSYGFRGRRRATHSVFDKFRDFQAETKRQEEELMNGPSISSKKRKTLEDLFRPPLELIHKGSFESAKDAGRSSNKWLMVNVQDSQEFACQILNRDLWSSSVVKSILCEHFIFWQVYHDSEEGKRYSQFYKVLEFPYIAVLDPRTGENLAIWNKVDSISFCDLVTEFLTNHPNFSGNSFSPPLKKAKKSLVDISEEQQMEAALAASLQDASNQDSNSVLSSDDEIETFESDEEAIIISNDDCETIKLSDENSKSESWKDYLGDNNDADTRLIFRYPDGKRGDLSIPSSSKLKAITLYVASEGYAEGDCELITNFPKRNLSSLDMNETLKGVGLLKQETIFVQTLSSSSGESSKPKS